MRKKLILLALTAMLTACIILTGCNRDKGDSAASGDGTQTVAEPDSTSNQLNPPTPGTGTPVEPTDTSSGGVDPEVPTAPETETEAVKSPEVMMNEAMDKLSHSDKVAVTFDTKNELTVSGAATLTTTTTAVFRLVGGDMVIDMTDAEGTHTIMTLCGDTAYLLVNVPAEEGVTPLLRQKVKLTDTQREMVAASLMEDSTTDADVAGFNKLTLIEKKEGGYTVEADDFDKSALEAVLAGMGMSPATVNMDDMYARFELDANGLMTEGTVHFGFSYMVGTESVHLVVENSYVFDYADTLTVVAPEDAGDYEEITFEDMFGDLVNETVTLYVTANVLRVRSTPNFDVDDNIVGYLHKGDAVEILALNEKDRYAVIMYKDALCYIGINYLSEIPPQTEAA